MQKLEITYIVTAFLGFLVGFFCLFEMFYWLGLGYCMLSPGLQEVGRFLAAVTGFSWLPELPGTGCSTRLCEWLREPRARWSQELAEGVCRGRFSCSSPGSRAGLSRCDATAPVSPAWGLPRAGNRAQSPAVAGVSPLLHHQEVPFCCLFYGKFLLVKSTSMKEKVFLNHPNNSSCFAFAN